MSGVSGNLQFKQFSDRLRQEVLKDLLALSEHLTGLLQQNVSVGATANLRGSFGYTITDVEDGVALSVGTPVEYGAHVEFGTLPHWVPIEPLIRWVNAKLESFVSTVEMPGRPRKRVATGNRREKMVKQLAFAIQAKIAKKGTEGRKYMEKSLREMGLQFVLDTRSDSMVYQIDLEAYLGPRMPILMKRAGEAL
mgnify:CR=1 FL=1